MRLTTAVLVMIALVSGAARATQGARGAAPSPRFEAVSIKDFPPQLSTGIGLYWVGLRDPTLWRARGQPLLFLVMAAYGLGQAERSRVIGLPEWSRLALFDVEAKVPEGATNAQIPLMVQAMLADRFKLKAHWEVRPMRAVALTVAPGGVKMRRDRACESPDRPLDANPFRYSSGNQAPAQNDLGCGTCAKFQADGRAGTACHGITMKLLATTYSGQGFGLPVLDRTQLAGAFDFTLRFPVQENAGHTPEELNARRAQAQQEAEQTFRTQLGLDFGFSKPVTLPVPVLVVERVEKPTPN